MANERHKPKEIVVKLQRVDARAGRGMARVDAIREVHVAAQAYIGGANSMVG